MNKLEQSRLDIEKIDKQMIELFEKRMSLVREVVAYKKENNMPIFQPDREKTLTEKNISLLSNPDLAKYYRTFFEGVLKSSKEYQEDNL